MHVSERIFPVTDSFRPLVPLANLSASNPFIICAILDESGSMHGHEDEVVESFNRFIGEQRKVKTPTVLYLSKFQTDVEHIYKAQPLELVAPLNTNQYRPAGGTALFDAVGANLDALITEYPGKRRGIIFVHTDGKEVDSRVYNEKKLEDAIGKAKMNGWDFVYVGALPSSWKDGKGLGMQSSGSYDPTNVARSYATISANLVVMRSKDITSSGLGWNAGDMPPDAGFSAGGRKFKRG